MTPLFDSRGAPVRLGAELGRGGEGVVYEVAGQPDRAAKIYLKVPDRDRADKLAAMAALANERLLKLSAWPLATLHGRDGHAAGFVMPRISGHRPVFQVYGPKLRLQNFPRADWRFLVRAAANAARAFSVIHACGHVVGDVNHGNLLVAQDATVRLIDTDSFQITQGTRRWLCEVGVSTHQPPEMQGLETFRTVPRTPNHDAFGLAVMIFQLLCMGRHPFSGRYVGTGEPPDIEHAIADSRYAYSRDQTRTRMIPAAETLPVSALGEAVAGLFEAAFAPTAVRGGRPPAERWVTALEQLETSLIRCDVNAAHWYAPQGACPWCRLEARGAALFPVAFLGGEAGGIALLWQQIEALAEPPPLPPLPGPDVRRTTASPAVWAARRAQWRQRMIFSAVCAVAAATVVVAAPPDDAVPLLLAVGAAASGLWVLSGRRARRQAAATLRAACDEWAALEQAWQATDCAAAFAAQRRELEAARRDAEALPQERARRLAVLAGDRRRSQFAQHLQACSLTQVRVPGVGKSKVATLLSYGIDSAADIEAERIAAIPGFGPKTVANLVAFRHGCEASFRFDPAKAVAASEVAALDNEFGARRVHLEAVLRAGLARLAVMSNEATRRRGELEQRAADLRPVLAQAMADARLLGA